MIHIKPAMENPKSLRAHALSWIDAWNRHDVDGILSHYADDVIFQAITVVRRWNKPDGVLRGKAELRAHFKKGLELAPDLHFDFEEIFTAREDTRYSITAIMETESLT